MIKKIIILSMLLCGTSLSAAEAQFPALTGPVVDSAGFLTIEQVKLLSAKSLSLQKTKGSQIAVCIIPTTSPLPIEDYGIKLAEKWKIGRAKIDDGIIIIVAKNDRKMRIEVGRGLEGVITDLRAGRIVDQIMAPEFRRGNFYKGIETSMDTLITFINGGDVPAISAAASTIATQDDPYGTMFTVGVWFIIGSITLFIVFAALGKIILSLITSFIALTVGLYLMKVGSIKEILMISGFSMIPFGIIALFLKFDTGGGSSSSSGYSSSSSSSSYSSSYSSSSGSSYSGGGGSFGGGGASGSW